jgi:uncharacterized cupredoxin-like copper-binding protein
MRAVNARFLVALATVVVAALTLGLVAPAQTAKRATANATTIRVKAREFLFRLSARSAPRGRVTFVVTLAAHDFKIDGKKTPLIQPLKTARLTLTFTKAGKYPYRCTVFTHASAGMKGLFTIR